MTTEAPTELPAETPPAPVEPVPPPPMTPGFARPTAQAALWPAGSRWAEAVAAVASAKTAAESWTDEFWAACGYDKTAVLDALTELEKLTRIYAGQAGLAGTQDFSADAAVLTDQAPA